MEFSPVANMVLQLVNQTNLSMFITGKAGTGKTTLLHEIVSTTHKNTIVVAPTGIAAINAKGVTIHSQFQLAPGCFIPDTIFNDSLQSQTQKFYNKTTIFSNSKMNAARLKVIQTLELLIIDEVSMLRADLLDAINFKLQKIRRKNTLFGGVQVVFIGDLLQLPPIYNNEEWSVLQNYYQNLYFFSAQCLKDNQPLYIELTEIYRQTDATFISILENLRNNKISDTDKNLLQKNIKPLFDIKNNPGYILLTTHNYKADDVNRSCLESIQKPIFKYEAKITGDFPEKIFPMDSVLSLKVGAQIMFLKNDLNVEKHYYNGKMGVIEKLSNDEIYVRFPENNKIIEVEKYEWKHIKYDVDPITQAIKEDVIGTFVHFPLKLAWAITIHKSQGLTFSKAALDVSQVFVPGQLYVALSRLTSLENMVLMNPLPLNGLKTDTVLLEYNLTVANEKTIHEFLTHGKQKFLIEMLQHCFNWHDLIKHFEMHVNSYQLDAEKSEKTKHANWANNLLTTFLEYYNLSQKFKNQLYNLSLNPMVEVTILLERVKAANQYFLPNLEKIHFNILEKLDSLQKTKHVKDFFLEVLELEVSLYQTILAILKAEQYIVASSAGLPINKINLQNDTIQNYKSNLLLKVRNIVKSKGSVLDDDSYYEVTLYESKTKKEPKLPKKSTLEETFELWQKNPNIDAIAQARTMSISTIEGHLAKLIKEKKIELNQLLNTEKIEQISSLFQKNPDKTIGELKDLCGDTFSWSELRYFKSYNI
ncbi:MAG: helix-turn-helix domain-containing protein [Alphaproteobacteria bacterium]|nr:helix-turn-helix domain-containing protein [Alphaproteobacteria bacterium]